MTIAAALPATPRADALIRVMIVDDAVVVRGLIARWLTEAGGFEVVGSHRTGRLAVDDMARADPDVVILDIEMPDMDGIEALPLILRKKRSCAVIMASTLTRRHAEISLRCLSLGALDCIAKPTTNRDVTTSPDFRREIIAKVEHLGRRATAARGVARRTPPASEVRFHAARTAYPATVTPARQRAVPASADVALRPFSATTPRILLIGASTGGPQALQVLLEAIAPLIDRAPVLITQHMPATFTTILAEHLSRVSGKAAAEAQHGEPIRPGRIYVAPGGRHMVVRRAEGHAILTLDDGPLVNFCRPSVDPMASSAAQVFGSSALAVILTGMGTDGLRGAGDLVAAGGTVIAQDEASSVVWGMPGAVAHAGYCSALMPVPQMAQKLLKLFAGDRS